MPELELKPCPVCGVCSGVVVFDEALFDGKWMKCYCVACSRGCLVGFNAWTSVQTPLVTTIGEAVRIWNGMDRSSN